MIDGKCIRSGGCPFDCDDKTCLIPKNQAGAFTLDWPFYRRSSCRSDVMAKAEARVLSGTEDWPDLHCTVIHDSVVYEIGPSDADEQVLQAILSKLEANLGPWLDILDITTTPTTEE